MDSPGYVALSRQSGLMREIQLVANNIANLSTTGFRREGIVFAEHVERMRDEPSLSLTHANARMIDLSQAGLTQTGGSYDLAIQGEGFFLVETPEGQRLTRAGSFTPSAEGDLVTPEGWPVLDAGGTAVFVPADTAVSVGTDGTISANGEAIGQIGLYRPVDPLDLRHQSGTTFIAADIEPAENGQILQGFLEESNVNPVAEIARMILVQRAYELGQKFLDSEDERTRSTVRTLGA